MPRLRGSRTDFGQCFVSRFRGPTHELVARRIAIASASAVVPDLLELPPPPRLRNQGAEDCWGDVHEGRLGRMEGDARQERR